MSLIKRLVRCVVPAITLVLLNLPVHAASIHVASPADYCFTKNDFLSGEYDDGIFLASVPSSNIAVVCYGTRVLQAGDAIPKDALDQLTLHSACVTEQTASVEYYTLSDNQISSKESLQLSILPPKNDPPKVLNSQFETYRNIANSGTLKAEDPEGAPMTFTLITEPKRGSVELYEDGTFTYTPAKNKVGTDKFSYTATDNAGNTSEPATVSIKIKKPSDKTEYADMTADSAAFEAMWLKENKIFKGEMIDDHLCFSPDTAVTRGDFLVMVMKLVDAKAIQTQASTGFLDESETPVWLRPYLVAALSNGMITGDADKNGVSFRPTAIMTKAEAAVMLQNILDLPMSDAETVFAETMSEEIPEWAAVSAAALSQAGFPLELSNGTEELTRRDCANLFYHVKQLIDEKAIATFYWVQ